MSGNLRHLHTIYNKDHEKWNQSVISSVAQSCLILCDPMNHSMPGLPVHHQLPEFTQIHVHWVSDAIQPSHPLSSPSPPALNPSQHQSLFQWVNSSHEVAKVLEFQLQHHSLQRNSKQITSEVSPFLCCLDSIHSVCTESILVTYLSFLH